jgi:hypothetical protein
MIDYTLDFFTSALYNEEKSQWVWTATGQSVNYTNWDDGQPKFNEGEGYAITIQKATHKMVVLKTSSKGVFYGAHYICEKSTSANGPQHSQLKQKTCSAGSGWTCRNEVTGCYCHQTISVYSSFALSHYLRMNLFHRIDRGLGRMPPHNASLSA